MVNDIPTPEPIVTKTYTIGLDLGQSKDYTALVILETLRSPGREDIYNIRNLERTRGTPYTEVVDRVKEIMHKLTGATLVVDQTGVGAPVVDMFRKANLNPAGVLIHGGATESHEGHTYKVPKRNLVGVVQVPLQNKRLQIADSPLREILVQELLNFKVKIDPETAHDSYSAWRENDHDDLVLATALAIWWAAQYVEPLRFSIAPIRRTYDDILKENDYRYGCSL
jgi:Terminase RNaseH-like domain